MHCIFFFKMRISLKCVVTDRFSIANLEWLFVCFGFSLPLEVFFTHMKRDFTITDEELQMLTYARHPWPLSREGSLACHTYCDTENQCIMVISEDPWHSHLSLSVYQWRWFYMHLRLRSVVVGIRIPNTPLANCECKNACITECFYDVCLCQLEILIMSVGWDIKQFPLSGITTPLARKRPFY